MRKYFRIFLGLHYKSTKMSQQKLHVEPSSSMSSSDMSIISKKMESMSMSDRVLRHNKRLPQSRYSPYTLKTNFVEQREKQKEEAVRLGVELSLFAAEAMFLLSDDIRSVLLFGFALFKYAGKGDYDNPVVGRLIQVMQHVFETYIKPKNGVYQDDSKLILFELIKTTPQHFGFGIRVLDRIVSILKHGLPVKSSVFEIYDQEMKMLQDKLRFAKHVSEANGFAREAIQSNILHFWKSLFETTPQVINPNYKTMTLELFRPVENEVNRIACSRRLASLLI